ncbi:MAG: serine/threonine protein kinase, partial [Bacteroidales bacterium]|nr:serine/threonine protein kinase [Bacteroidales bacterium]
TRDADADKLPFGQKLKGEKMMYTIHWYLGHGYFGYTYTALAHNEVTGEEKEVVLKEFYPYRYYHRDGIRACLNDPEDIVFENESRSKFIEEAKIMHRLGLTPDSHIVPAFEYFRSEDTDTVYYVMPFYNDGSLYDLQKSGFTFSEDMLINHVVIPMCKALNTAHKNKVLHLDIKPENILVDEHSDAVLIDFGVAKQYDDADNIINRVGLTSSSMFASPELQAWGGMVHFGEQPDIYGLAATLYYLATDREEPHSIMELSEQDRDIRENLRDYHFSDRFADAVVAGLQHSASLRPKNAQAFLNLFPGCEDIRL